MKASARGMFAKDDRYSYLKTYIGMDAGGTAQGAPALPGGEAAATPIVVEVS